MMTVNLDAVFWTFRAAVQHMLARAETGDAGGSLLVTSSTSAIDGAALTAMRSPWKVRVAGWTLAPRRPPRTRSTKSANSKVRSKGCSSRRRAMAPAMRRAFFSSP